MKGLKKTMPEKKIAQKRKPDDDNNDSAKKLKEDTDGEQE